jgi:cysteine synthase
MYKSNSSSLSAASASPPLHLAEQPGPHATIVTVMCDMGMKYLKTFGAKLRTVRPAAN